MLKGSRNYLLLFLLISVACVRFSPDTDLHRDVAIDVIPEDQKIIADNLATELLILDESPVITSFIVAQKDTIIFEKYFNGSNQSQGTNIQSVTKVVISALTGIAKREGYIKDVDQKLSELFPTYFPREDDDLKNNLTLRHLLTMSAGLQWESDEPMYREDPLEAILNMPLDNEPGKTFHYNSGLPHIISILLIQESGINTRKFAEQTLFEALDITVIQWELVNGIDNGCCGLWLTSRDLVKLGLLYLHHGVWNGVQVIPEEWVLESTQFHIEADNGKGYGYYWWLTSLDDYDVYSALGLGGQFIHVIPDLNLVVVGTKNLRDKPDPDPYEYKTIEKVVIPLFVSL